MAGNSTKGASKKEPVKNKAAASSEVIASSLPPQRIEHMDSNEDLPQRPPTKRSLFGIKPMENSGLTKDTKDLSQGISLSADPKPSVQQIDNSSGFVSKKMLRIAKSKNRYAFSPIPSKLKTLSSHSKGKEG